jgi:hypothetical protein
MSAQQLMSKQRCKLLSDRELLVGRNTTTTGVYLSRDRRSAAATPVEDGSIYEDVYGDSLSRVSPIHETGDAYNDHGKIFTSSGQCQSEIRAAKAEADSSPKTNGHSLNDDNNKDDDNDW